MRSPRKTHGPLNLQQAFLPHQHPCFTHEVGGEARRLRFYHRYNPTGRIGGDFFDLLEISPLAQPGLMHHLSEDYFNRINAVDFTVKHDDGLGAHLDEAEIVLNVAKDAKVGLRQDMIVSGLMRANNQSIVRYARAIPVMVVAK